VADSRAGTRAGKLGRCGKLSRGGKLGRGGKVAALALTAFVAAGIAASVVTPLGVKAVAARLTGGAPTLLQQAGLTPAMLDQARPFDGTPAVGALFTTTASGGLGTHFCTASVIDSPRRDLLMTAAHCVSGSGQGPIVFVPGYHDGQAPYGVWRVTRVVVDQNWASSQDADDDFAFLVTAGRDGTRVQDVTGGERLAGLPAGGADPGNGQLVAVVGSPGAQDRPILCQNRMTPYGATQLQFDCAGYSDGTSGSPLLANVSSSTALGTVVGVIGGYQRGGYTSNVSYAARLGPSATALYDTALNGGS
jgi:V8-like Glu-specific endopeptidase